MTWRRLGRLLRWLVAGALAGGCSGCLEVQASDHPELARPVPRGACPGVDADAVRCRDD